MEVADYFGANIDGVLAEEIAVPQNLLAMLPAHVDFTEGATFTCAGVTGWNALFVAGWLEPGASVLLLGTGGVSIWLQLAKAGGLKAYIASSSDEKLACAKALGADGLITLPPRFAVARQQGLAAPCTTPPGRLGSGLGAAS